MKKSDIASATQGRQVGGFEILKLVRQYVPIDGDGIHTFGQLLDMKLEEAAMAGEEVQTIKLEVEEGFWSEFVARIKRDANNGKSELSLEVRPENGR